MTVSKQLVRGFCFMTLRWAFSHLHQVAEYIKPLGENAVNERIARHWLQKFRSGNLSLCDEPRSDQAQVLDDEALKVAIEEDNSQTCGELAERFQVSDETVRFTCTAWGRRTRWASEYTYPLCRKPTNNNEWQPVSRCFLGAAMYLSSAHQWRKVDPVWQFQACHTLVVTTRPPLHQRNSCAVSNRWVDKRCIINCCQRAKASLWTSTRSSWNVCNRHEAGASID